MKVTQPRWDELCAQLNIVLDRDEFDRLISAYSQPHRYYHTLQHLWECLEQLDWAIAARQFQSLHDIKLLEAALWYHDVVYQPQHKNNEQNSANWVVHFLSKSGLSSQECQLIRSLILATCHHQTPINKRHQLMVDIDLSILGAQTNRFQEYDRQIRQEYCQVPRSIYQKKRKEVLSFFLSKPRIYSTELFSTKFEYQARKNITRSIKELDSAII